MRSTVVKPFSTGILSRHLIRPRESVPERSGGCIPTPLVPRPIEAPPGLKLVCPGCRADVAIVREKLRQGVELDPSMLEFAPGQQRDQGETATCQKCGHSYIRRSKGRRFFHTEVGWI